MSSRNSSQKFRVPLLFLTLIALLVPQALAQTVSLSFDLRQQDPDRMEPHENKFPVSKKTDVVSSKNTRPIQDNSF
jgi:hypothetical protein